MALSIYEQFEDVGKSRIEHACTKYPETKYNFSDLTLELIHAWEMIKKGYAVARTNENYDHFLAKLSDEGADHFMQIFLPLENYSVDSESPGQTSNHDRIKQNAKHYLDTIITRGPWRYENRQSASPNNILDIYLYAIQKEGTKIEITDPKLVNAAKDATKAKEDTLALLDEAKRLLAPMSIANYAAYFAENARENSAKNSDFARPIGTEKRKEYWKRFLWHFGFVKGAAQRFFFIAVSLIIIGVLFVVFTHSSKPLIKDGSIVQEELSALIERILGIVVLAYLIRICFKQYSIRKHLYTINRHRASTLDSFRLLYSTVGKESPEVRNDLILLVAAGVYNLGDTGFLNDRTVEESILPVNQIVEKLIEKSKDATKEIKR